MMGLLTLTSEEAEVNERERDEGSDKGSSDKEIDEIQREG